MNVQCFNSSEQERRFNKQQSNSRISFGQGFGIGQSQEQNSSSDDEPEVVNENVLMKTLELKCPISGMLIESAVVGRDCTHFQSFDLNGFLQLQQSIPQ